MENTIFWLCELISGQIGIEAEDEKYAEYTTICFKGDLYDVMGIIRRQLLPDVRPIFMIYSAEEHM